MQQFGSQDWRASRIREWLLLLLRFAITCDPKDQAAVFAMADEIDALACRAAASAAFAHPGGGESAYEEQQPDQSGEYRQHTDAAYHARLARAQPQPVVTVVGVARAHRDDARQMNAAAALDPYDVAPGRIGK